MVAKPEGEMSSGKKSRGPRGTNYRTGKSGLIRFNRDFTRIGVGRISNSSRTSDAKEFRHRDQILTKLANSGQIEILRAFRDGRITVEQLVSADREQRLKSADLLGMLTLQQPLWTAVAATLPRMGASETTRKRYRLSLDALQKRAGEWLPARATIADLDRVSWRDLQRVWGRSNSDWNHLRRAVSAFLTIALGDKFHPFRRAVITRIPIAVEVARVPDVTPELFWTIIKNIPECYRACFIAIVASGMRVGEYLRCTRFNLKPATFSVAVPGTKTAGSADGAPVHPEFWAYVEAAIPSPIGYKALRLHWKAACKKASVQVRIHDLRHCYGQWAVDHGVAESKVQSGLRHKTASMTRRYTKTKEKGEAAYAVGIALLQAKPVEPLAQVAAQGDNHV